MVNQNSIFGGMLTTAGAAKKTNCDALGIPWQPSHMLIGDANGNDPVPAPGQTQLINQVYRAPLNQLYVSPTDANVLVAELVLPPNVGGWWIRELALEDVDGVFSAVANCAPSYKPLLVQGSGRNQVVRMHIVTSGTSNIQLKIDPSVVLATREYVDTAIVAALNKQDFKHSVLVATSEAIVLNGLQNIDGVPVPAGARVLVKNQAAAKDNGIFVAAAAAWFRAADADASIEVTPGMFVHVEQGAVAADSVWQLVTDAPISLGTTSLTFDMIVGRTRVIAGTYTKVTVDKNGRVIAGTNPTTLAGLGITDVYTAAEVDAKIAKASSLPVGSMVPFATSVVPAGYLEINGDLFQDSVYPDLAGYLNKKYNLAGDASGWTRLPDSRGEFFRGWDHGRGVDAGRALGSWQKGTFHNVGAGPTADTVTDYSSATGATAYSELGLDDVDLTLYPTARAGNGGGANGTVLPTRTELSYGVMRPRNLSVMWCIKAWGAAINQGNIDIAALSALVVKMSNDIEVAIVYPGGGDSAAPGTVARSASYVVPNPFPGRKVRCQLELYYNSQWVEVYQNSSDDNYYGGIAGQQYDGDIRVVTASLALLSGVGNRGTFPQHMYVGTLPGHITAALPARVWVWKTKGQL